MPFLTRRLLRATAVVLAVAAAFASGVATGVLGTRGPRADADAATSVSRTVVDEAAERIQGSAARSVGREELDRAAVEGMLGALDDRWSSYFPPGDALSLADGLDGRYAGVGLWLRSTAAGALEVGSVQVGSPAATAGIIAGDTLTAVDGAPVTGKTVAQVVGSLRGTPGTTVTLAVRSRTGERSVEVSRSSFSVADVSVQRLPGKITLARISQFSRGVGRQLRSALGADRSSSSNGVVLDLRGDPGGLIDEAVEVASVFLDKGPVVTVERRGQVATTLEAIGQADTATPVVVMVDGGTASAAEVVAAALQDRNRAVVVGSTTFGKGSVQEPSRLSDGSALEITVGRYRTPSGRSLDGVGITPDVAVDPGAAADVAQRRAVEVLSGLVASLGSSGRG